MLVTQDSPDFMEITEPPWMKRTMLALQESKLRIDEKFNQFESSMQKLVFSLVQERLSKIDDLITIVENSSSVTSGKEPMQTQIYDVTKRFREASIVHEDESFSATEPIQSEWIQESSENKAVKCDSYTKYVSFPIFDGVAGELQPWISALETQFASDGDYSDLNKLALADYLIGGEVKLFVQRRQTIKLFDTWEKLKNSLLQSYGEKDDPEQIRLQAEEDRFQQELFSATDPSVRFSNMEPGRSIIENQHSPLTGCVGVNLRADESIIHGEVHSILAYPYSLVHDLCMKSESRIENKVMQEITSICARDLMDSTWIQAHDGVQDVLECPTRLIATDKLADAVIEHESQVETNSYLLTNGVLQAPKVVYSISENFEHAYVAEILEEQHNMQRKFQKSWKFKFKHKSVTRLNLLSQHMFMRLLSWVTVKKRNTFQCSGMSKHVDIYRLFGTRWLEIIVMDLKQCVFGDEKFQVQHIGIFKEVNTVSDLVFRVEQLALVHGSTRFLFGSPVDQQHLCLLLENRNATLTYTRRLLSLYIWTTSCRIWHKWKTRSLHDCICGCLVEHNVFQEGTQNIRLLCLHLISKEIRETSPFERVSDVGEYEEIFTVAYVDKCVLPHVSHVALLITKFLLDLEKFQVKHRWKSKHLENGH